MNRITFPWLAFLPLLVVPPGAGAQDPGAVAGRWHPVEPDFTSYAVESPAERARIQANFEKVVGALRSASALNPPRGADLTPSIGNIRKLAPFRFVDSLPYPMGMWIRLNEYDVECTGCAPQPERRWAAAIHVAANEPGAIYQTRGGPFMVGDVRYHDTPVAVREEASVLWFNDGTVAVVRRGRPLLDYLTTERYLQGEIEKTRQLIERETQNAAAWKDGDTPYGRWIANRSKREEGLHRMLETARKSWPDSVAVWKARWEETEAEVTRSLQEYSSQPSPASENLPHHREALRKQEAFLASLSPRQRSSRVRISCPGVEYERFLVCPDDAPGGRNLARLHPRYFDSRRPKTEFQLLVFVREGGRGGVAGRVLDDAWDTIDWHSLAALVQ